MSRFARDDTPRPFLKWAGGKRQILPTLLARLPDFPGCYFEPFVGAGALFFALGPKSAVLNDSNARLVATYRAVRDDPEGVIARLGRMRYDREFYYRVRAMDVDGLPDVEVAAWMIYLNRAGFNGLYRVNSAGRFNVPFGRYANPVICDAENLRACSRLLQRADIRCGDFADAVQDARPGDFVYFDPPYVPLSRSANFTAYTAGGFGMRDQERLRDLARDLKARGVAILLSNSGAPLVRELYLDGFRVEEVLAGRAINSRADRRGDVVELLVS